VVDSRIVEGMEEVYEMFDRASASGRDWSDCLDYVRRCTAQLNPRLRDAVIQVYGRGCSLKETAAALGGSPHAMAMRLSRARELVRKCLEATIARERHGE
jgi:DNA-directed RNA polymerase specialized sigma24 family protein